MVPGKAIFGGWLRAKREAKGVSQRGCARHAGIDEGGYRAIERGDRLPSPVELDALASFEELGIGYEEMLDVVVADKAERERERYREERIKKPRRIVDIDAAAGHGRVNEDFAE